MHISRFSGLDHVHLALTKHMQFWKCVITMTSVMYTETLLVVYVQMNIDIGGQ